MLNGNWAKILCNEFTRDYYKQLQAFLDLECLQYAVFPPCDEIFHAFSLTDFNNVKVVILGQDPYHERGQAHGLAFSVRDGVPCPPSLKNIFKEISAETHVPCHNCGDLTRWAKQGVFLLNSCLTVREGMPKSHHGKGWETFTDAVIEKLSQRMQPLVFMLWGNDAQRKYPLIDKTRHLILTAAHPSPLSATRGFFSCNHFNLANEFLLANAQHPIDWR